MRGEYSTRNKVVSSTVFILVAFIVMLWVLAACGPTPGPEGWPVPSETVAPDQYPLYWEKIDSPIAELNTWVLRDDGRNYYAVIAFDGRSYSLVGTGR